MAYALIVYSDFQSHLEKVLIFFGLSCAKNEAPHYESFDLSRNPSRAKCPNSFLITSLCTFSTEYGIEHIGYTSYFNSKSTVSVFQVPSVPSNNS